MKNINLLLIKQYTNGVNEASCNSKKESQKLKKELSLKFEPCIRALKTVSGIEAMICIFKLIYDNQTLFTFSIFFKFAFVC